MERQVYVYGFNHLLECIDCNFIQGEAITVKNMRKLAKWMRATNSECRAVLAVDNRPGLRREYLEAVTSKDFSKRIEFAETITNEGIAL